MILRRITQHVKDQNWAAIAIDFVIVVTGVFLGIQLGNWNEASVDRSKERAFVERMSVDVDRARDQLASFLAGREERLQTMSRVENMYFGDGDGDGEVESLSEWECRQFASMHLITTPPLAIPSITEAFAGGKIDLLSDPDLIEALITVEQSEDRLRTVIGSMREDRPVLARKYPEAVSLIRATDLDNEMDDVFAAQGYQMAAQCHFLENTPSRQFLSDVVDGVQVNQWYVTFLRQHLQRLDELAAVLDGEELPEPAGEDDAGTDALEGRS